MDDCGCIKEDTSGKEKKRTRGKKCEKKEKTRGKNMSAL